MPDLKVDIGFGVEGRGDFLFLENSYVVLSDLTQQEVDDCLEAEKSEDSDLLPAMVWGTINRFVSDFRKKLIEDYPEYKFSKDYTYGFEIYKPLN